MTHQPIIVAPPGTDEWIAARLTGFGASEAADVCGVGYNTPLHIYHRKRGLLDEAEDNEAMRMGRRLEPAVREEAADRLAIPVREAPCPMYRHPQHAFILATPDAILANNELLECKTTQSFRAMKILGEENTDQVPDEIIIQGQQQMLVMGVALCHVAFLVDNRVKMFKIHRDESVIESMIAAEHELWERIQNADPPEPDYEHPRTLELVKSLYKLVEGTRCSLDDHVLSLVDEDERLREEAKRIEAARDAIRAKMIVEMGDYEIGSLPDGREIVISHVEGCPISYYRKPYHKLTVRKAKRR